eukprot:5400667-Pleurochrysis_carterae.AAC.3
MQPHRHGRRTSRSDLPPPSRWPNTYARICTSACVLLHTHTHSPPPPNSYTLPLPLRAAHNSDGPPRAYGVPKHANVGAKTSPGFRQHVCKPGYAQRCVYTCSFCGLARRRDRTQTNATRKGPSACSPPLSLAHASSCLVPRGPVLSAASDVGDALDAAARQPRRAHRPGVGRRHRDLEAAVAVEQRRTERGARARRKREAKVPRARARCRPCTCGGVWCNSARWGGRSTTARSARR